MKPPHDMGGNVSTTVIPDEAGEPKFAEEWHRRALGLTVATGAMGAWNIDASRYARESLPADDYKRFSYYEKWLGALTNLLFLRGFVSKREIMSGHAEGMASIEWRKKILRRDNVFQLLQSGTPSRRQEQPSKFGIGQIVHVKHPSDTLLNLPGHTRLPHYIANKKGTILRHHGVHVLPNSNAHFLGEHPENLYAVEFNSYELWGSAASPFDTVIVDCWESYLEPVKN